MTAYGAREIRFVDVVRPVKTMRPVDVPVPHEVVRRAEQQSRKLLPYDYHNCILFRLLIALLELFVLS